MITYLKIVVICLGVLIAGGVAAIGYKLAQGTGEGDGASRVVVAGPDGTLPSPGDLGLPKGSAVKDMITTSSRLILNVVVPDRGERIVIIDLRGGTLIGMLSLEAGSP